MHCPPNPQEPMSSNEDENEIDCMFDWRPVSIPYNAFDARNPQEPLSN